MFRFLIYFCALNKYWNEIIQIIFVSKVKQEKCEENADIFYFGCLGGGGGTFK